MFANLHTFKNGGSGYRVTDHAGDPVVYLNRSNSKFSNLERQRQLAELIAQVAYKWDKGETVTVS